MVTFIETSRMLIPRRMLSKRELHSLTSGFSNDVPVATFQNGDSPPRLHPHLPKVMVVGFSHCGGNIVMSALAAHPHVALNFKHLKYFHSNRSLRWYLSQMPPSLDHHVTIDVGYSYVTNTTVLEKLKAFNESLKIIVFLCDPISRLLDNHTHFLYRHQTEAAYPGNILDEKNIVESLIKVIINKANQTLDYLTLAHFGKYLQNISELFRIFPRDQVLIMEKNRFFENPDTEMTKLHKFLGVKVHSRFENLRYDRASETFCYNLTFWRSMCIKGPVKNISRLMGVKHQGVLKAMQHFYAPLNKQLYLYLGEEYNWH
ncbi:heparan sulfate glucosamine 3-O-sulfotransferase 2-like [Physella acuta]|uniref:heparan sulfate glucosamine 3-O-sulfotransferase 2-like n=1 Tax=Physella acuta TaxID=109671 RepID=UPI0027DC93E0|nr:heparan sulfate glucosamine 3-O-sulfotransferase 2-like [Physella acuta]